MQDREIKHRDNEVKKEMKILSCEPGINSWQVNGWMYVEMNYGACLKFKMNDKIEVGYGMVQLYRAGLGTSREVGKIFGRSSADVIRKTARAKDGLENLIDYRKRNGRRKKMTKVLKAKILANVRENPCLTDKGLSEIVNQELPVGHKLSVRTVKRYLSDSGAVIWRKDLRQEEGGKNSQKPETQMMLSRYAGVYLSIGYLEQIGFGDIIANLKPGIKSSYSNFEVGLSVYFLYLIGKRRLYDLDSLAHRDFGALIGKLLSATIKQA